MQIVYNLVMMDMESSYDNHNEEFNIGFFSSRSIAEKTAAKYQQEVNGFKDYPVTYQIKEKNIINASITQLDVFIIYGWNENDELDEIDVFILFRCFCIFFASLSVNCFSSLL